MMMTILSSILKCSHILSELNFFAVWRTWIVSGQVGIVPPGWDFSPPNNWKPDHPNDVLSEIITNPPKSYRQVLSWIFERCTNLAQDLKGAVLAVVVTIDCWFVTFQEERLTSLKSHVFRHEAFLNQLFSTSSIGAGDHPNGFQYSFSFGRANGLRIFVSVGFEVREDKISSLLFSLFTN